MLQEYCTDYNTNPDQLIRKCLKELKSENMTIRCHAEDMVMAYYKQLVTIKPGTAINVYRRICSFYRYNFVRLQTKDPGYTVQREQDYLASKDETRKMCELLNLEGKTYLLVLVESCGCPGHVANLQWKDIQEELYTDKVPMKIYLKHKVKTAKKKYFTFICKDAKESLQIFVQDRNLNANDKVFSISYSGLRKRIMKVAERIRIYQNGKGKQSFRLHTYRKRGQTILEKVGVPLNWVDRILGHIPRGAQGATYSLPDIESMRTEYAQAISKLEIYETYATKTTKSISEERLKEILVKLFPNKQDEVVKIFS